MMIKLTPSFGRKREMHFPFYLRPIASWKAVVFGLVALALLVRVYPF